MTNKEAHSYLEDLQRKYTRDRYLYKPEFIEANGLAILSLEKQISKKPYWRVVEGDVMEEAIEGYACPVCDIGVTCDYGRIKLGYCPSCGQMLDWSDEE